MATHDSRAGQGAGSVKVKIACRKEFVLLVANGACGRVEQGRVGRRVLLVHFQRRRVCSSRVRLHSGAAVSSIGDRPYELQIVLSTGTPAVDGADDGRDQQDGTGKPKGEGHDARGVRHCCRAAWYATWQGTAGGAWWWRWVHDTT